MRAANHATRGNFFVFFTSEPSAAHPAPPADYMRPCTHVRSILTAACRPRRASRSALGLDAQTRLQGDRSFVIVPAGRVQPPQSAELRPP